MEELYNDGLFNLLFAYIYIFLLIMTIILSLALPIERSTTWFNIILFCFGVLTILSIVGMVIYLQATGFMAPEKEFNPTIEEWEPTGNYNFSYLVLAGVIMLSIYLVPFIMRPVDFLSNIAGYTIGLIAYLLMIPMFVNVFSIYSFCNLHDVSWGNRPTTSGTGTEAFSASLAIQQKTQHNFEEFRANVLFIWICLNGAYFFIVLHLTGSDDPTKINDGSFGPL